MKVYAALWRTPEINAYLQPSIDMSESAINTHTHTRTYIHLFIHLVYILTMSCFTLHRTLCRAQTSSRRLSQLASLLSI